MEDNTPGHYVRLCEGHNDPLANAVKVRSIQDRILRSFEEDEQKEAAEKQKRWLDHLEILSSLPCPDQWRLDIVDHDKGEQRTLVGGTL